MFCRNVAAVAALLVRISLGINLRAPGEDRQPFWPMKGGGHERTGFSNLLPPEIVDSEPAWTYNCRRRSSAVIDDEKNIYISCEMPEKDPRIIKFNEDGKIQWEHRLAPCTDAECLRKQADLPFSGRAKQFFLNHTWVQTELTLYQGKIFFMDMEGIYHALDMETGTEIWHMGDFPKTNVHDDLGSILVDDGVVSYTHGWQGPSNTEVVGLRASDGKLLWKYEAANATENSVSSDEGGRMYFSDGTGRAYCLDLKSGKEIWKSAPTGYRGPTTGAGILAPSKGIMYVPSNQGNDRLGNGSLRAYNMSNGALLWERITELQANVAPAVGRLGPREDLSVLIATGPNPGGYDSPDGKFCWNCNQTDPQTGRFIRRRGQVMAFDATTGELQWKYEMPEWHSSAARNEKSPNICGPDVFATPVIAGDGKAYAPFMDGRLYVFQDRGGDTPDVTDYDMGVAAQGAVAFAPGMAVVSPCDGLRVFK